ncbi:hypothetical protein SmJEL517_g05306 [Synchytrium microbalum]|uniref:Peptidase S26 domain-containing protein n=1 Tax=Synchytrium microbalum TaxID=1806994 RepID=A0A507C1F8_9FUNG|nr:uncharacterized protein SmJEL517_g05306 [Synchytrium microbalum]TPX31343.1 hypothetical protein SmJEL517_g05306 [Synchytrium microbalum]
MRKWMRIGLYCISPVLVIHLKLYSIARVSGNSMSPALNPDYSAPTRDIVFINKIAPTRQDGIQLGDVVFVTSPMHPDLVLCKRVMALEDDLVCPKVKNIPDTTTWIKVPKGNCWVESDVADNKDKWDSNKFGPIPLGLVTARVDWIIYPFSRWGRVESKLLPASRIVKAEDVYHSDLALA